MTTSDLSLTKQKEISNWKVASILSIWIAIWVAVIFSVNYLRFIQLKSILAQEGKSYVSNINTQLASCGAIFEGFSALFGTVGEVNPKIVRDYVQIVTQNNPQIFSLEIAIKIPAEALRNLTQEMRAMYSDFTIKSFSYDSVRKWEPISKKNTYIPLIFIAPNQKGTDEVIGLDLDSVPFLKVAIDNSLRLNRQVATRPFNLVEGNKAFVIFGPIQKYFHPKSKMATFDYESQLITDVVIDTDQLSKQARIYLDHGESLALYHSDFLPDDTKGNLFTLAGDKLSSYEVAVFPEIVYEESLFSSIGKFNVLIKHQLGLVDFDIRLTILLFIIAAVSSCMLLVYLWGMQKRVLVQIENEKQLWAHANYDNLTGLANRRLMTDRLIQYLAHARRSGDLVAICMLDLDGFKQVNDQLGHEAGDALLIEVAKRLRGCIRQSDTVSRFGGDEFSLVLSDVKEITECEQSFKRIITSLAAPYQINNNIARVTASLGATIFPIDGESSDLLIRHADQAMYQAKEAGKNCYCLFNASHHKQQITNKAMLEKIGKALEEGQFTLFYQPQVNCRLGQIIGIEALIRWNHPILGLLTPPEFIPLLEHDNLIINVGKWVINEALRQLKEWVQAGFDLKISVNVAARQLHHKEFVAEITKLTAVYDFDILSRLTFEIVETTMLEDIHLVSKTIKQCRELGVKFAIDDFGTGFSSLAHLKHFEVIQLKIAKIFVMGMLLNPEDLAIVRGVIALGTSFNHRVIAQGVESIDQILMLMELGCVTMQGFAIARPMPAIQFFTWLEDFEPDPLWFSSLSRIC